MDSVWNLTLFFSYSKCILWHFFNILALNWINKWNEQQKINPLFLPSGVFHRLILFICTGFEMCQRALQTFNNIISILDYRWEMAKLYILVIFGLSLTRHFWSIKNLRVTAATDQKSSIFLWQKMVHLAISTELARISVRL